MKLVEYQTILAEKLKRQKSIPGLEFHASGHCVHVGKISPGCRGCFTPEVSMGIQTGTQCMYKCPYCYYDPQRAEQTPEQISNQLIDLFARKQNPNWNPIIFALQSSGETLLYLDELEEFVKMIRDIEKEKGTSIYLYLYSNGVLMNDNNIEKLKSWGVQEVRFHVAASGFSKQVFENISKTIKQGITASVELPSMPHYREKLFETLPIINSLGVKHLNLVECQVTPFNIRALDKIYPEGRIYQDYFIHLYDEGLVYDLIEEVIAQKYNFSILDCNSGVERCRQGPGNRTCFNMDSIKGMCSEWDYYKDYSKR